MRTDMLMCYLCMLSFVSSLVCFQAFPNLLLRDLPTIASKQKQRVHNSWSVTMQFMNCWIMCLCRTYTAPLKCDIICLNVLYLFKERLKKGEVNLGAEKSIWRLFLKDKSEFKTMLYLLFVSWINDLTCLPFCIFNKQEKWKWVNNTTE